MEGIQILGLIIAFFALIIVFSWILRLIQAAATALAVVIAVIFAVCMVVTGVQNIVSEWQGEKTQETVVSMSIQK